ncbi:vWA domain-containing protein [Leucobacter salsicius]|uniref:vWA domain-containing protein n=1 Tax=Leucobacter salsicius TaxID=664638 RepID=UPI0012F765BF|nr:vWA domain-containing protein [Leucobacter salsicius]
MSGEAMPSAGVAVGPGESAAREALRAVAALVGIPVTVTNDDDWLLDERGLRAGLGWYARRGHSPSESAALALLQLWEGVRGPRLAPERAARARLLAVARPELSPLVAAIARAQAAAEVIAAFPGMRAALAAALHRGLPRDLSPQPHGDQWLALVLATGFGALTEQGFTGVDEDVQYEWLGATDFGGAAGQGVRWVLRPDPDRSALERFERAIALLAPGYERLIAAAARGLGADAAAAPPHEGGAVSDDSGAAADDAEAGGEGSPDAEDAGEQGAAAAEPPAHARPGGGAEAAEGADLFQAEQAGEVTSFLDTPLPAEGALNAAFAPSDAEASSGDSSDVRAGAGGSLATRASDYMARVASLASSIEHMRDVWHEVTAERVARVASFGRRPEVEGESLDTRALADGLAQVRAGVSRPRVFLQREHRTRRTQRSGNTDYVLLIDRSASMQGRPARAAADAAIVMLEGLAAAARDIAAAEAASGLDLELQLRTALIVFDARAQVVKPLSSGMSDDVRADLLAAILTPQGSTNDSAALTAATEQLRGGSEALQRRRIAFVLSDGGTNDAVAAEHALRRLRATGVTVFGIGLGSDDLSERYAPHGSRVDDPELLAEVISTLIARHLP